MTDATDAFVAELQAKLDEARQREQRFGRAALQGGIEPEEREAFRNAELSARAETKLRQMALEHTTRRR